MKHCRCGRRIQPLHNLCAACRRKHAEKCRAARVAHPERYDREPTEAELEAIIAIRSEWTANSVLFWADQLWTRLCPNYYERDA